MKPLDAKGAKLAARGGAFAAIVLALATVVLGLLIPSLHAHVQLPHLFTIGALAEVVLYAAIAFGIFRMSRAAAVAGLALYTAEQVFALAAHGSVAPIALIFLVAFANAVRGVFAYHRLVKRPSSQESAPSS